MNNRHYDHWSGRSLVTPAAMALAFAAFVISPASAQEACCLPDGSCTEVLPADCATAGGTARGPGTACATVICPASNDCSAPAVAIPDNNPAGVDDTITVAAGGTIADVNVYVRVDHTFVGDLIMTLQHVDTGTTVVIYDRPGVPASTFGCGSNNLEIILDDEAGLPIEDQCSGITPAIFGSFIPQNPLAAFDGEDRAGMWTLNVSDNAGADTGTLIEWCLFLLVDADGDGVDDLADVCPGFDDNADGDGDGVPDGCDLCNGDDASGDSDGDGTCDDLDNCPTDPNKLAPGICGCGTADDDSDTDGAPDCFDQCPNDPNKIAPGVCGCGNTEMDSDGDGVPDCADPCQNDANKVQPGPCGCNVPDVDTDGDGWLDCFDNCPNTPNSDQADADGDGVGDVCTPPPAGQGTGCAPLCGLGLAGVVPFSLVGFIALRVVVRRRLRKSRR